MIYAAIKLSENTKKALIVFFLIFIILFVLVGYISLAVRGVMRKQGSKADEMLSDVDLYCQKSEEKLLVPCGFTTTGGAEVVLDIGDRYPHYLIGGTTGSGKSNLLHNIIVCPLAEKFKF